MKMLKWKSDDKNPWESTVKSSVRRWSGKAKWFRFFSLQANGERLFPVTVWPGGNLKPPIDTRAQLN